MVAVRYSEGHPQRSAQPPARVAHGLGTVPLAETVHHFWLGLTPDYAPWPPCSADEQLARRLLAVPVLRLELERALAAQTASLSRDHRLDRKRRHRSR